MTEKCLRSCFLVFLISGESIPEDSGYFFFWVRLMSFMELVNCGLYHIF